jgi:hypothetical protein
MVVVTCPAEALASPVRDPAYRLVVSTDAGLAERLALSRAGQCQAGYVLLDAESLVRYRTYDDDWVDHAFEQEVLLGHLAEHG